MPRSLFIASIGIFLAGAAAGAEKKTVVYFEEVCGVCHGDVGQGTPGLAPALKGSKFVVESSDAEIAATITKGRSGAEKRYKSLPSPMPAQSMGSDRLAALISYLKNELQK